MTCIYLLESISHPGKRYVGITHDLNNHTAKFKPWRIVVAIRLLDARRAESFEKCLKSGSG
jgi:predicted GIY-YIG superfamily endonuclease